MRTAGSVGHDVRRVDRGIVEPEQREERAALRHVEAGDRDEAVPGRVAAVVGVHRVPVCDLGGASREIGLRGGSRVSTLLAFEPDEVLHLHRERRCEEGDVDHRAPARRPCADEGGEHRRCEQVAGREVGHRDPARANGDGVTGACVRREEA